VGIACGLSTKGYVVQQAISKASISCWSVLHEFARHDWPVLAKGGIRSALIILSYLFASMVPSSCASSIE
jgi:hypothetical protein